MSIDAKTIAFYDTAAQRYADLMGPGHASEALKSFMALLPVGAEVLDLGCGPARASVPVSYTHLRAHET